MSAHEEQPVSAQALADLDQALWRGRTLRGLRDAASPQTHRDLLDTILEAGWRPPLPPTPEWQVNARVEEARATSLGYCEHVVEVLSDGEEETCGELRERGSIHCAEHQPTPPAPSVEAAPDGWYPAAMREHDRANAAELDRTAAERRAASWWEAAKTLNRWGTAHRELHRKALVEITNLTAVRDELAHQRNDHRARADAAEAKLAVFMAANIETFRALDAALAEGGEARAKLDQVRAEIRAVLDEFMGSDVAEALVWNREIPAVEKLAFSLRAIVERESATRCVNDTNGDGDCAACAHNPNAPCRSASEEPTCACDRPVARCSCRIADLCKAAADKLDTEGTTP